MSAPRYPNQQLRSVSLETYFRGRFSVTTNLPKVQARVEDKLPQLFVPNVKAGEALALRPYQMRDNQQQRSLAVALNQATYVAFSYPGYEEFGPEAVEVLTRTLEALEIPELSRVSYQYDNAIDLRRDDDGSIPLNTLANMSFPEWLGSDGFVNLDVEWRRSWEHGAVFGKMFQDDTGDRVTLRVIHGAVVEPAGAPSGLRHFAEKAHARARATFESMITDEFREFLKWNPGAEGEETSD